MVGNTLNRLRTLSRARAGAHLDIGATSRTFPVDSSECHFTANNWRGRWCLVNAIVASEHKALRYGLSSEYVIETRITNHLHPNIH